MFGGISLEPTDAEGTPAASERSWLLQFLAEPHSQLLQFRGVGPGDGLPLKGLRCSLKDTLLDQAVLILATDNESNIFAFFEWIVTL